MIKCSLFIMALFFITSCATTEEYNQQKNCSVRALDYLAHPPKREHVTSNPITPAGAAQLKSLLESANQKIQTCYQQFLNLGHTQDYNVCTVIDVDHQGKIDFLDIDDRANQLDDDLKNCMTREMDSLNFNAFKSLTITQPYRLHSTKR